MKKEESDILNKLGKDPGFKVPENYFADFNKKLSESLPEVKITPVEVKPKMWVRVRTYVYMAAMFAGIWCMMKVFNGFNGTGGKDKQATEIASGIQNEKNADEFIMNGNVSDYDIMTYEDSVAASDSASSKTPAEKTTGK
jgi:hypothetical protein